MNLIVAVIQMNSNKNWEINLDKIINKCLIAKNNGADFISLPENAFQMPILQDFYIETEDKHPAIEQLSNIAKKLKIWIHLGSLAILNSNGHIFNRSYIFDNEGTVVGTYDKINLFNARVEDENHYNESAVFTPGNKIEFTNSPWGNLGLSICYDIRFPIIYNRLAAKECKIIFIPAAFTYFTGKAHWNILLRARAIETQCFIVAAAQCGIHNGLKKTYGHSSIVDPWGNVIACTGNREDIIYGTINMIEIENVKNKISINFDNIFQQLKL